MSFNKVFKKEENNVGLRAAFKDSLTKLIQISTRQQALRQLKTLIVQNKTTINLRVWLSVLAENRNRHSESEINIIAFIVQQYGQGLLDPLDKVPSLEKTVFRITELLVKLYFCDQTQNVMLAVQKAWVELYLSALKDEEPDLKKKLLYNNLEAILNGGADKISQMTAQFVLEGLLQSSLNREDLLFFKQIAKRTLVLFLKTTVIHPSVLTCLQTVLGYFNTINLIPLLQNIVNKVIAYINLASPNSLGYRIKAEACNSLGLIGQQIDQNGIAVMEKVLKQLENLSTDKVWAVQVTGRKAVTVWRNRKKEWEQEYSAKNQQVFHYPTQQNFFKPPEEQAKRQPKPRPVTAQHFNRRQEEENRKQAAEYKFPDYSQDRFLHKNTGVGGGNTVQSVENYYQRQRPQETYDRKMEEIRKSIYQPKEDYTEYDETVPWDQAGQLPTYAPKKAEKDKEVSRISSQPPSHSQKDNFQFYEDEKQLQIWQKIVDLYEEGKKQESVKALLQLDDDIYFLRFMLKYGKGLLADLTRPTASKLLKQTLAIKRTNFMQQLFFKLVAQSAKSGVSQLLTNQQNMTIVDKLEQCTKIQGLQKIAAKLRKTYQRSLTE